MQVWFVVGEWQHDGMCSDTGRFFTSEEAAREYASGLEQEFDDVYVIEGEV